MDKIDNNTTNLTLKAARSLPIPKEVNNFVLKNFGLLFYNCQDCSKKIQILKEIVSLLNIAGYMISAENLERRLKNMKSHYRRKKSDLDLGLITSVDWEYFQVLDQIFAQKSSEKMSKVEVDLKSPTKRKAEPKEVKTEGEVKPQDLSIKRPKLIEFCKLSEINEQIPPKPVVEVPPNSDSSNFVVLQKVIESLKAIDQQRLVLDQQRISLEIRRYELDVISSQLTELLFKLTHPEAAEAAN